MVSYPRITQRAGQGLDNMDKSNQTRSPFSGQREKAVMVWLAVVVWLWCGCRTPCALEALGREHKLQKLHTLLRKSHHQNASSG